MGKPTLAGPHGAMISPTLGRAGVVAAPPPFLSCSLRGKGGTWALSKLLSLLYADLSPTGVSTPYPDDNLLALGAFQAMAEA